MTKSNDGPLFISLNPDKIAKAAIESQYDYLNQDIVAERSSASTGIGRTFVDFDNNISVKSDFNRRDYEYFRANTDNLTPEKLIDLAQKSYEKVGIVRNTMDTMSNLGCQGIRIQHPVRRTERFLQAWFNYVGGPGISEQFLNILYCLANVPVKTAYGTIDYPSEQDLSKTKADMDNTEMIRVETLPRVIPLKYSFVYPNSIEAVGGNLNIFMPRPIYAMKLPADIRYELSKLSRMGKFNQDAHKQLSQEINKLIQVNSQVIPLDPEKFDIYFYKKKDWQLWATPMISSILNDLIMLERMKLADNCALDGAISNIRHWTVGIIDSANPQNNILPTMGAINRIKNVIANNVGGGTMDLVTGPEVAFKESATQVHHFLGSEKYEVTLNAIYDGLGIPPPLRSVQSSSSNATNNYVSLKTLVENLKYGRSVLTKFWNKQLQIIQKAMGHAQPGQVMYDQIILSDEGSEKKLLIELVDRDLISAEAVQHYFGFIPGIEKKRVRRDAKERQMDKMPRKAGQFHNAMIEEDMKLALVQNGDITPSEAGIELEERKEGETPRVDKQITAKKEADAFKSKMKAGRPTGVTETSKRRKKPNFRPRASIDYFDVSLWAEKAYDKLSTAIAAVYLTEVAKANLRQLTSLQSQELEKRKFVALCNLEPLTNDITIRLDDKAIIYTAANTNFDVLKQSYLTKYDSEPSLDEARKMQILSYIEAVCAHLEKNGF